MSTRMKTSSAVVTSSESNEHSPVHTRKTPAPRNEMKSKKQNAVESENQNVDIDAQKSVNPSAADEKPVLQEKVVVVSDSEEASQAKSSKTVKVKSNKKPVNAATKKKKARVVQVPETSPKKKQTTLTDHFKVRRSERASKTREIELAKLALQKRILSGAEDGLKIQVIPEKGRGIFADKVFLKGDFVCEYAGELIEVQEAKEREIEYEKDPEIGSYMYFFEYKSKKYCIDATEETDRLGRLLNHSKTASNVSSKLFPINDVPYLILCASVDIQVGEELLYDYGDRSKKSLDDHPWLAE